MASDDDRIKSAFEIAMEKAGRLGSLSDEERKRAKDTELASAGNALAERYVSGLPLRDIDEELKKRRNEEREAVRRHLLSHLAERIALEQNAVNERILAAVSHLSGDSSLAEKVRKVLDGHESAVAEARRESQAALKAAKLRELELKGISGSAVEPAVETAAEWLQMRSDLDSKYRARLEELKHSIQKS